MSRSFKKAPPKLKKMRLFTHFTQKESDQLDPHEDDEAMTLSSRFRSRFESGKEITGFWKNIFQRLTFFSAVILDLWIIFPPMFSVAWKTAMWKICNYIYSVVRLEIVFCWAWVGLEPCKETILSSLILHCCGEIDVEPQQCRIREV